MENKKLRRWESKKRKVEAFLQLTKDNPLVKAQEESNIPCKQVKTDSDDDGDSSDQGVEKKLQPEIHAKQKTMINNPLVKAQEESNIPCKKTKTDSDNEADSSDEGDSSEQKLQSELQKLRAEKHARQKAMMQKPKLYLTLEDLQVPSKQPQAFAMCPQPAPETRYLPLFIMDLQHLILYATQGNIASYKPRWCKLLRVGKVSHVIVLVLNEVSVKEYTDFQQCFPYINSAFQMKAEMISPTEYGSSVFEELLTVPVSMNQTRRQVRDLTWFQTKKEKEKTKPSEDNKTKTNKSKSPTPSTSKGGSADNKEKESTSETNSTVISLVSSVPEPSLSEFSRLHLLLSPQQMIKEDYPLPVNAEKIPGYRYSHRQYTEVTKDSPMYAVDCEMCMTEKGVLELTRVSIVDEKLEVVYDTLVKPYNRIINYLTRYSGITKELLKDVTTRIEHVQKTMQRILPPNSILCGQSLNGDLHALKLYHPYVIDTSVIYNLTGIRGMKPGLKRLAAHFLQKDIQTGKKGHSPVEDATTTMELVNLKLSKGQTFGDIILGGPLDPDMEEEPPTASEKLDLKFASYLIQNNQDKDNNVNNKADVGEFQPCKGCRNCKPTDGQKVEDDSGESETSDSEEQKETESNAKVTGCKNCLAKQTTENVSKESAIKSQNIDSEKGMESDSNIPTNTDKDSSITLNLNLTMEHSQNESDSLKKKEELVSGSKTDTDLYSTEKRDTVLAKSVFFKRPGSKYSRNFFHLTKESKKTVSLIGNCPEFCEKSLADDDNSMVTHTVTESDKKTAKQCRKSLCGNFLTMASFSEFKTNYTEEKQQKMLEKLDQRVKKILKHAPVNSLVTVLLGGHTDGADSHKALCFTKVI